jgi:hypothetical protein
MLAAVSLVAIRFECRGYRPCQDRSCRMPFKAAELAIQDAFDWFDPSLIGWKWSLG